MVQISKSVTVPMGTKKTYYIWSAFKDSYTRSFLTTWDDPEQPQGIFTHCSVDWPKQAFKY